MDRRNFLQRSALLAGASLLPWQKSLLAAIAANPAGEMKLLRGNVGIYTERGGTIAWYATPDALVVVDTQFPEQANNLLTQLREKTSHRVDLLINTHHHGDHTAGNIAFKGLVDKVVGHVNCRANQERAAKAANSEANQLFADTTFQTDWSQAVAGEVLSARYFGRAHTDGDAVIHFENANIAHLGDLVFNRRFPYIDTSAGASIDSWIEVLSQIRKHYDKDTAFVCGHSGDNYPIIINHDDLLAMRNYLNRLRQHVKKQIKKGLTEEQVIEQTKVIPKAEEWTGGGIERSIKAAFVEYGK
ncbi:MAG: MBL fold metallo-hydrolase [Lewinellaceae bacterium]|nr:MBL fold metallo-hydrolase [Lewinellaceae bacterium]